MSEYLQSELQAIEFFNIEEKIKKAQILKKGLLQKLLSGECRV